MFEENNNNFDFSQEKFKENPTQNETPFKNINSYGINMEVYNEKRDIRRKALTIGIPCLCLSLIGILWSAVYIFITTKALGMTMDQAISLSQNPAVQQILQIVLSCVMFLIPFTIAAKASGYRIDRLVLFNKVEKTKILPFLFFGIGFCAFANIATSYASAIFEGFGIEYEVDFGDNPRGLFGFMLTFIATAVVPALIEEFACRGIVLGILRKYGDGFAIVSSSIVFGIMHGNFEQIPFAIIVGLILGYIYVKTSSIWICVIVHAINNAISVIFSYMENSFSINIQNVLYIGYIVIGLIFSVLGVYYISKKDEENYELEKTKNEVSEKQKYKFFFSSWSIILFIIFNLIEALSYFIV